MPVSLPEGYPPMFMSFTMAFVLPPFLLLLAGLIPDSWANRHVAAMRRLTLATLAAGCVCSTAAAAMLGWSHQTGFTPLWTAQLPLGLSLYFDSLSAVMTLLTSFIGLVIARYSLRYLQGEATQGRFLRWMMFTLGSVLLMVVSGNLLLFIAAWMLTSLGLHQLLTHYPDRPWAIWAARKKFLISRLGDAMLVAAVVLTFQCFGSLEYTEIFARLAAGDQETSAPSWMLSAISLLLVFGGMTKSAQFPWHTWLPDTMETPTPVSALMHAGVINAGGFLVIRLSPLVSQSSLAMDLLALTGAFTAILGSLVMLTQTSVKRALAYSTIAQMGFMMLQCGLGAFSAALLHMVAHSAYKAHAFLSSGSVLQTAAGLKTDSSTAAPAGYAMAALPAAVCLALGLAGLPLWLLGVDLTAKAGASVLSLILLMALTCLIWNSLLAGSWRLAARGIAAAAAASWLYLAAWMVMAQVLSHSASHQAFSPSPAAGPVGLVIVGGFLLLFAVQEAAGRLSHRPWLRSLYVHAVHGFYLDIPARRLTARLWGVASPAP